MARVTARSSTIFISSGGETLVYRSVEEIPPALRKILQESTQGINSATILIADKRGREELVRAIRGQPSEVQCRLAEAIRSRQAGNPPKRRLPLVLSARTWLELLLTAAVGASLWFFIDSHF